MRSCIENGFVDWKNTKECRSAKRRAGDRVEEVKRGILQKFRVHNNIAKNRERVLIGKY